MQQQSSIGGDVSLTREEVQLKEQEAEKARDNAKVTVEQHNVMKQWYWCLGKALERSGGHEPDFVFSDFQDALWIGGSDEGFVQWMIGDQLEEYGLVLKTRTVRIGSDNTTRVYIGNPGQFDLYER